ncbi:unnamed protein product (macronuclear) [Paramecium tetraurelia]|uniref:HPt domain-containing protein n=1 Tax=Paramecium tetraurelia TaxID=5888 RepID=A0CPA2_PARTE|nr:uncharacterized protein GSPATT00009010001 [Paramecium tetraurelia]CAK72619.1 unnamed protein product [Paramecium tetraurelia]|eukprot:XP_001440016.1 hypothetical protein (macronuclear) [Paramecium tetraurelia strain d4-2]
MADTIINYTELQNEYKDMAQMIIQNFESTCFDQRMEAFLQGMLNKDWVQAMTNSHTLKGSAGYIKAGPFIDTIKIFQQFVKDHCILIQYPDSQPPTVDRPQYRLKDEFDDEKKMQAYEYFHPIIEQARLLKFEMSKYSGSVVADNIFLAEGEKIQKMHEELRQRRLLNKSQGTIQTQQQINSGVPDSGSQQGQMVNSVLHVVVVDQPQSGNSSCCDKCAIF